MKNYLKIFTLLTVLLLLDSCSYFSNSKEEKREKMYLKHLKEEEILENKNFQYISQLVSYKNSVSKDTVNIVLKEYYKTYKGFSFNNTTNKLEEAKAFSLDEKHKLDFLQDIVEKYKIPEKSAYLIFYEIDSMLSMASMKDNIETIDNTVDEIASKLSTN